MKAYIRNIFTAMPTGLLQGWKAEKWRGAWIVFCVYVLKGMPARIQTRLSSLENLAEARNYEDNFMRGELRNKQVEALLARSGGHVVELGVNIGITTRWWLSLHPNVFVTGIDMMDEAISYTTEKVRAIGRADHWQGICAAVGNERKTLSISFEDPLEGTNSVSHGQGSTKREVQMERLDVLCQHLEKVTLLKIDIEGAGGQALEGAPQLLSRTDWVAVETHGREETRLASQNLQKAGFVLDEIVGRMMWWQREASAPGQV